MKNYEKHYLALSLLLICNLSGCSSCKEQKLPTNEKELSMIDNKNNVQTTASGLQYIILEPAKDPQATTPNKGQTVSVHYTGWLEDKNAPEGKGQKFDSSVDRGQPLVFNVGVGMVIPGWDEGLMLTKVGEKRRLIIPAKLGYGAHGAGAAIPPHANLIFDVELLEIK